MFFLELGQGVSYFHREFRLSFILQKREEPALVGNIPARPGSTSRDQKLS